jgi:hypothetical protein
MAAERLQVPWPFMNAPALSTRPTGRSVIALTEGNARAPPEGRPTTRFPFTIVGKAGETRCH